MTEMIGYCGYNCHLCAARSDDPAVILDPVKHGSYEHFLDLLNVASIIRLTDLYGPGRMDPKTNDGQNQHDAATSQYP